MGTISVVRAARNASERLIRDECLKVADWFDVAWDGASEISSLEDMYTQRFRETARAAPPVTDEDTLPARSRRGLRVDRIRKLRTAENLWIEAGNLHENRGVGVPGNQLMMSAMTRVFFGFAAQDVPTDSTIGSVAIRFRGAIRWDCSLRYSNNAMDVLTMPLPGGGGPPTYDQETLLFTRAQESGKIIFDLTLGSGHQPRTWKARSSSADAAFEMQGGRQWGVF